MALEASRDTPRKIQPAHLRTEMEAAETEFLCFDLGNQLRYNISHVKYLTLSP